MTKCTHLFRKHQPICYIVAVLEHGMCYDGLLETQKRRVGGVCLGLAMLMAAFTDVLVHFR